MRLRLLRTNAQSGTVPSPNKRRWETHSMTLTDQLNAIIALLDERIKANQTQ